MANNFYSILLFNRSFDTHHIDKNTIHLISSIFYTDELGINNLSNYKDKLIVIKILHRLDGYSDIIEHSKNLIELQFSLDLFFSKAETPLEVYNYNSTSEYLSTFMDKIVGNKNLKGKDKKAINNKVLFVFENLDWNTLTFLFKSIDINISGGSISRRHLLSTAEFNLIVLLFLMGYRDVDIYNSSINWSKYLKLKVGKLELEKDPLLALSKIIPLDNLHKKNLIENILLNFESFKQKTIAKLEELNRSKLQNKKNIAKLEKEIEIKQNEVGREKALTNNIILSSSEKIQKFTEKLNTNEKEINVKNLDLINIQKLTDGFISKLENITLSELINYYKILCLSENLAKELVNFNYIIENFIKN